MRRGLGLGQSFVSRLDRELCSRDPAANHLAFAMSDACLAVGETRPEVMALRRTDPKERAVEGFEIASEEFLGAFDTEGINAEIVFHGIDSENATNEVCLGAKHAEATSVAKRLWRNFRHGDKEGVSLGLGEEIDFARVGNSAEGLSKVEKGFEGHR